MIPRVRRTRTTLTRGFRACSPSRTVRGGWRLAICAASCILRMRAARSRPSISIFAPCRLISTITPSPTSPGLLGFAFHPDFAMLGTAPDTGNSTRRSARGRIAGVADYLDESGENQESVIYEWTVGRPLRRHILRLDWREVLRIGQFGNWHNVGAIAFDSSIER